MSTKPARNGGTFVGRALRSAWPGPPIDDLLRAITLPDTEAAAAAWRGFESIVDFDDLTWGQLRLVSIAARRMVQLAPDKRTRGRIAGIERAMWSRGQVAIGQTAPALRALRAASVDILVIKGASQAAQRDPALRGRAVNDIDIVVRPEDLECAFDIAVTEGWVPAGSGTVLFHRSRLADAVGINLVRGELGNLDLHRTPFHPPYDRIEDDPDIWARSLPASLAGADVRVPSPTDTVTIAIAHGAPDAHKSSDWLADIAAAIDQGVDWDLLVDILERRRMQAPGAIVLGYASERLERPVPANVLERLTHAAARRPVALLAAIAEARPKTTASRAFWLARAWAKQGRLLRTRLMKAPASRVVLASPTLQRQAPADGPVALEQALALPDRGAGEAWAGTIDVTLQADLPAASRRVDFEVNTADRHHLRLRALVRNRGRRAGTLRFRFALSLSPGESAPVIAAAPSRTFNAKAPQDVVDRYRPIAFRIVAATLRTTSR